MIAIVDDEDYTWLNQFKWRARRDRDGITKRVCWRAIRVSCDGLVSMHREITGAPKELQVDHIHKDDGAIDNRKQNLRLVSNRQNAMNQRKRYGGLTGFKGVSKHGANFQASISVRVGQKRHLGTFSTDEDAALTYDAAARILFGEFAHTNFPYVYVV